MNAPAPLSMALLSHCAATPWKNGGGVTRELLCWEAPSPTPELEREHRTDQPAWALRVSVADIDRDGPFSSYPEIDRVFAVLDGAGVDLEIDGDRSLMTPVSHPLAFAGEAAVQCLLTGGPSRDLNLMVRRAAGRPLMKRATAGDEFGEGLRWRALFASGPATIETVRGLPALDVPSGTLCWSDQAGASWRLLAGAHCFWLGMADHLPTRKSQA